MSTHTPGRLTLELVESDTGTIKHLCPVDAEGMSLLTVVDHDEKKFAAVYNDHDARRLVACWNALIGVPTEMIENAGQPTGEPNWQQLKAQRDELLSLLNEVSANFTREDDLPDNLLLRIDTAIAKAEGGTA